MEEVQVFESAEFGKIRVVVVNGVPWFAGRDVAVALEYKDPKRAVIQNVTQEEDVMNFCVRTNGGTQKMKFISETGVILLVMRSRLPSAQRFQYWIASEVVPSVLHTGMYLTKGAKEKMANEIIEEHDDKFQKELLAELRERNRINDERNQMTREHNHNIEEQNNRIIEMVQRNNDNLEALDNSVKITGQVISRTVSRSENDSEKRWKSSIYAKIDQVIDDNTQRGKILSRIYKYMEDKGYVDWTEYETNGNTLGLIYEILELRSIFEDIVDHFAAYGKIGEENQQPKEILMIEDKQSGGKPISMATWRMTDKMSIDEMIHLLIKQQGDRSFHGMRTWKTAYGRMDSSYHVNWKLRRKRYAEKYGMRNTNISKKKLIEDDPILLRKFKYVVKQLIEEV